MTKSTITKLFIGGTLAAIAGAILAVLAFGIAYASDVFIMSGDQVVGVSGGARDSKFLSSLKVLVSGGSACSPILAACNESEASLAAPSVPPPWAA